MQDFALPWYFSFVFFFLLYTEEELKHVILHYLGNAIMYLFILSLFIK
jgi:hypothetical protein